jgi:ketopantoate reductase
MPSLNPLVDQNTFLAALKNGSTNLEQELGPNWKNTVQELITEVEFMREANLPHAMFETKAGAVAGVSTKE